MRAVFLGTPDAAIPALGTLHQIAEVAAVITQPDRPRGRSSTPQPPPVKVWAEDAGLPVIQPGRSTSIAPVLDDLGAFDVAVVVAFGMLIKPNALQIPSRGFINVHFSLLPRWRGASPVTRAMIAGDDRTGVTIMRLDEGLDTGPTLASVSTAIGVDETGGSLTARLASSGARLLAATLPLHVSRLAYSLPQPSEGATLAPKLTKEDRRYEPGADAMMLRRRIMAMAPVPGVTAVHEGTQMKLLRAGEIHIEHHTQSAGTLTEDEGRLWCWAPDGRVELLQVQPAGKRAMDARAWMQGRAGRLGRLT